MFRPAVFALSLVSVAALLGGCDMLGIESPEKVAAAREAEGKAVGGACRHAGRAIEDCYTLNRRVDKASIFAGWRDMNDYMRENKIEPVAPVLVAQVSTKSVPDGKTDAAKSADAKGVDAKPAEPDVPPADKAATKPKAKDGKGH
jgi:hypothetical protein